MILKLLSFGWIWKILLIILVISVIIYMFNIKFLVDDFTDLDLSCDAIQNKYYHTDELLHKSHCPNLVIIEKNIGRRPIFFAELGDHNGPYFSKDYTRYYYMGTSPDGIPLNLEYDLYYYPWYNPSRWFNGPYGYHPRGKRRRNWKRDLYNKWDDYSVRLDKRNNRYNRNKQNPNKQIYKNQNPNKQIYKNQSPKRSKHGNTNKGTLLGASSRL